MTKYLSFEMEDYISELEKDWKTFTPYLNSTDLVEIFGKEELLEVCKEKISELWQEDQFCRKQYQKQIKFISKKASTTEGYTFCETWLDATLGERINGLEKQLKRFSVLHNFLKQKTTSNKFSEAQLEKAREFPTYELYVGRLRHIRDRHTGLCPFHTEKTPSFVIYDDGSYHCFGCGAHGRTAIDYLMQKENLEFREAVSRLC